MYPAAGLFRGIVAVRNRLYDRGMLRADAASVPVLSVGNLAAGGAGKTPVSAWFASRLVQDGSSPGIVMRGYGDDEPLVHRELNPRIPVLVYADRVAGIRAAARIGCDVAVLDDAFQHRRAARDEDVVLVSADSWGRSMALLPAGPWREPMAAVRRATLAIITVKAATQSMVAELESGLAGTAPTVPVAVFRLTHEALRPFSGEAAATLSSLRGKRLLGVAAIAEPEPFFLQLERHGATVTRRPFADHHQYRMRDVAALRRDAERHDMLVCTLKDAVKLRALWPHDAPAGWYVSQSVAVEKGEPEVAAVIQRLLARRRGSSPATREIASPK
jgi:tetraacyldisaccharide 4'-kinase